MSGLPEVIYLIKDSCRYEVVWSDSAFPYGDKKYISAAKAKADKLALLEEVAHLINPDIYCREDFRIIWRRIEAE